VVSPPMGFLDRGHDRILGPQRLGMELGVLEAKVLFELGVETEAERALGTLQRLHAPIVACRMRARTGGRRSGPLAIADQP
jgi:hypothetical protein